MLPKLGLSKFKTLRLWTSSGAVLWGQS